MDLVSRREFRIAWPAVQDLQTPNCSGETRDAIKLPCLLDWLPRETNRRIGIIADVTGIGEDYTTGIRQFLPPIPCTSCLQLGPRALNRGLICRRFGMLARALAPGSSSVRWTTACAAGVSPCDGTLVGLLDYCSVALMG